MQQSRHEIADALLWLNYSPQAQPALPKIDEGKGKGWLLIPSPFLTLMSATDNSCMFDGRGHAPFY